MEKARLFKKEELGKKAYSQKIEIGKWFKFAVVSVGEKKVGYGKVVEIIDEEYCLVEKYFELPSYRPYAAHHWYDDLPMAIN